MGFTVVLPSVGFAVFMTASVYLLGVALKFLPFGTAYTVWTGIGAVPARSSLASSRSANPPTPRRPACIGLILAGIVGLKLVSPL